MARPLLLKTFIFDAQLKDTKTHPDHLKEGKGGYYVCLEVVDFENNVPSPEFKFRTKVVPTYSAGWSQSCAISIDPDKINTYKALKVSLWKEIGKSSKTSVASLIGNCSDILLKDIPEGSKIEQRFQLTNGGEPQGTLRLVVAWYGSTKNTCSSPRAAQQSPSRPTQLVKPDPLAEPEKARLTAIAALCKAKEREVAQLKKLRTDLQDQLAQEKQRKQKMEKALLRYRDVDENARELVGGGVDWNQVRELDSHQKRLQAVGQSVDVLHDDKPATWASYILADQNLNHVDSIHQKLSNSDSKWIKDFLNSDALANLHTMLHLTESKSLSPEMSVKESSLVGILTPMFNNQSVIEHILRTQSHALLEIVSLILASPNTLMKTEMFYFLSGLAIYSRASNKLLQEACNNNDIKDLTKKSTTQAYNLLCRTIRIETDAELLSASVSLVNGLIAGNKVLSQRMHLRSTFVSHLGKTFEKHRATFESSLALTKQLDAFCDMEKRDNKELSELRFIGKLNLSDPRALFTQIAGQAEALGVYDLFFRHMQQLMLIPYINGNPHALWGFIENASRAITSGRTSPYLLSHDTSYFYYEQYRLFIQSQMKTALEQPQKEAVKVELVELTSSGREIPLINHPKPNRAAPPIPVANPSANQSVPPPPQKLGAGGPIRAPPRGGSIPLAPGKAPITVAVKKLTLIPTTSEMSSETDLEDLSKMFDDIQSDFFADPTTYESGKNKKKVQLLPANISNQISILRKQFKITDYELIRQIFDIEKSTGSLETHHYEVLLQCIPSESQMEPLLKYKGPLKDLDTPEQFALQLYEVPKIREKLKALLFWDTFSIQITTLETAYRCMIDACKEIYSSSKLKTLLGLILSVGNFLNSGTHRSNCRGFDFKTLKKVSDVRATGKSSYTLINYLVEFCLQTPKFTPALKLMDDLPSLAKAKKLTAKSLLREVELAESEHAQIVAQLKEPQDAQGDYSQYFDTIRGFVDSAKKELGRLRDMDSQLQQSTQLLVSTFGSTAEDVIQESFSFAEHITRVVRQVEQERAELELEKSIADRRSAARRGWQDENWEEDQNDSGEDSESKPGLEDESKTGIMVKLISSVRDADFRFT